MLKSNKFRRSLSHSLIFIGALSVQLFIQSCDKDDPSVPSDTELPSVSITNVTDGQVVWNTVTVSIAATDNQTISKVEVFVDGNVVSMLESSPFQFEWDSNTVSDGTHVIKIAGTDASGNKGGDEVSVIVKNTLVSVSIKDDQLEQNGDYRERGIIFLSDAEGNLVAMHEYENGEDFSLKSAGFNGEVFFLTEVLAEDDPEDTDGHAILMWTFANIERGGKWSVGDVAKDISDYAGDANLIFTNPAVGAEYHAFSNGDDQTFITEADTTSVVRVGKTPGKLYVRGNIGGDIFYHIYDDITVGDNDVMDLDLVDKPVTIEEFDLPEGTAWANVSIEGYLTEGDYEEPYDIGYYSGSNGKVTIDYPGNAFATYFSKLEAEVGNMYLKRGSSASLFDVTAPEHSATFNFSGGALQYSATGDFDFLTVSFEDGVKEDYWWFILPQGTNQSIPTLELPAELEVYNVPAFSSPTEYTLSDYDDIENYDDLIEYLRNATNGLDEFYEAGRNYLDVDYELE